ncbi:hypothetical protein MEBOL_003883 [Melittangium boletus DSM 14713]|uniref:Uncharacterized protein n=1 Tax=Melittangium boletus DSM 14713 TaxID=1294270 RepID=A0A250IGX8_9BACT|nr:hypothetical protein MEBOL_003883 [Melittangium boletus DSM 14713]
MKKGRGGPLMGPPERCARSVDRPRSALGVHACPGRAPHQVRGRGPTGCLEPQHHAAWGGPRAGAHLAPAVGKPRCSRIARTPQAPFTYATTLRRPPHPTQANTSKSNVLLSNSAQSTRGVLSFLRSLLAAASSPALASSAPAGGSLHDAFSDPEWIRLRSSRTWRRGYSRYPFIGCRFGPLAPLVPAPPVLPGVLAVGVHALEVRHGHAHVNTTSKGRINRSSA